MLRLILCFALIGAPSLRAAELGVDEIQRRLHAYASLNAFKSKFRQVKRLKALNLELVSEGELTVRRPQEVVWKVTKPSALVMTLTPTEILLITGEGSSRREDRWRLGTQLPEEAVRGIQQLVAWLKLDAREIASSFRLVEERPNEFLCLPKKEDPQSPFKSFRLFLGKKGHLEKLLLEERSNDSMEIFFAPPTTL